MTIAYENSPKLTIREVAELLRVSMSWVNKSRLKGNGPPFVKIGRRVVYNAADIEKWLASKKHTNTSQYL